MKKDYKPKARPSEKAVLLSGGAAKVWRKGVTPEQYKLEATMHHEKRPLFEVRAFLRPGGHSEKSTSLVVILPSRQKSSIVSPQKAETHFCVSMVTGTCPVTGGVEPVAPPRSMRSADFTSRRRARLARNCAVQKETPATRRIPQACFSSRADRQRNPTATQCQRRAPFLSKLRLLTDE